jgi:hypothetical protein
LKASGNCKKVEKLMEMNDPHIKFKRRMMAIKLGFAKALNARLVSLRSFSGGWN